MYKHLRKFHNLFHEFEKKSIAQETEVGNWRHNLVFFSVNFERRKKKMCRWNLLRIKENENGSLTRYLLSPKTTTFCNLKKTLNFFSTVKISWTLKESMINVQYSHHQRMNTYWITKKLIHAVSLYLNVNIVCEKHSLQNVGYEYI